MINNNNKYINVKCMKYTYTSPAVLAIKRLPHGVELLDFGRGVVVAPAVAPIRGIITV